MQIGSFLCPVRVMHARLSPVRHEFEYRHQFHQLDLDELDRLQRASVLWGYNRWRPFALYDADYLQPGNAPLREKLRALLSSLGYDRPFWQVTLLTTPRYFGIKVFNPVSFYYCRSPGGQLAYVVAEINNTFYERYVYVIDCVSGDGKVVRDIQQKAFHVSPFFSLDYKYDFQFFDIKDKLDIRINLVRAGEVAFTSRVTSDSTTLSHSTAARSTMPFSTRSHVRTLFTSPLQPLLTIPKIFWQALQLSVRRRLPVYSKPNPTLPNTIRAEPVSWFDRLCHAMTRRTLKRITRGCLTVILPDGRREVYGDAASSEQAELQVHSYRVYRRVVMGGGIGLGESYVDGDWSSRCLTTALKLILNNTEVAGEARFNLMKPVRWLHLLIHRLRSNTVKGSKKNIGAHYDLSNDLFGLFLDPSMTYSCGYYQTVNDSLEQAQKNKISRVLEKAQLTPSDHILEIGSGWGSLAMAAAQRGCKVTSLTLSKEQLALARERVRDAGLSDRVGFELCDYRMVQGSYDKIVSVEMLEAVGHEHLPDFFGTCERVLKPDGVVVLQVITMPDQWYEKYKRRTDFIQKHIFPGSHLPSLSAIIDSVRANSKFIVESIENIGPHYARTLREWREKFDSSSQALTKLGYDERFKRLWRYYLCSCEAEFATRWLNVVQMVLTRPNNSRLVDSDQSLLDRQTQAGFSEAASF